MLAIEGGADIGGDLDRLGAPGLHGDVGHGAGADRAAGDGGGVSQVEGRRTEADGGTARLLGWGPRVSVGKTWRAVRPPRRPPAAPARVRRAARGGPASSTTKARSMLDAG